MKTDVKDRPACPHCGTPLPEGFPGGLCAVCLLAQGADTEVSSGFHPPPLETVAELFPQLEILGLLGSGGMGAVFQARQPALDRIVALKVLPAGGETRTGFEERFNREARALARLSHPNIVTVHEFGRAGDLHYFLMEFVDGSNLRQLEKAGRLSPRESLQLIPQICDALQYAHDQGVVHRDIKPENVLVDRRGRVKIADFGLARILGKDPEAARLTSEGQVMGTPHYMAPEQLERPLSVDHRADIYSLGVVIYEMLTGDLPLGNFSPPSRKVQVDVRLDEVVLRALENDPESRYQRASEVKSRVEIISSGPAPDPSRVEAPQDPALRAARRRRMSRPAVALVTAALGLALMFAIGLLRSNPTLSSRLGLSSGTLPRRIRTVAAADPKTGALAARLPGGGTLELVAVAWARERAPLWWRPDGKGFLTNPLTADPSTRFAARDESPRFLVFRSNGLTPDAGVPVYSAVPAADVAAGGEVRRSGRHLGGAWPVSVGWPRSLAEGTLEVGIALEPWRTVVTHHPNGGGVSEFRQPGDPPWSATLNHFGESGKSLAVTLVIQPYNPDWETRVVASDSKGGLHTPRHSNGSGGTWTYLFDGLTPEQVRELRFQVRPLEWMAFPRIALQPPSRRAPEFGEIQERVISEVIDFDTGATADFPPAGPDSNPFTGAAENVLWMQEQGYDAAAGSEGLDIVGMEVVPLDPGDWESLPAADVLTRLSTGKPTHPRLLKPSPGQDPPTTVAFRTQAGGVGLLQVLTATPGIGTTVRFKRITPGSPEPGSLPGHDEP